MGISLDKGGNVDLTKAAPGLATVVVGCGWDPRSTDGVDFDVDASALVVGPDGKILSDLHLVFYGNRKSPNGALTHKGDNLTGDGGGDDEQIVVDLLALEAGADRVVIVANIYDAVGRGQTFGQVRNAFIRVVNEADGVELARFDLGEDYAGETSVIFGELYRHGADWKFRAVGQGYSNGLVEVAREFGADI